MMDVLKTLQPKDDDAISKVTITITAHVMNKEKTDLHVKTDWLVEGENNLNLRDLHNIFQSGYSQIVNKSLKVDQN